MIDLDRSVWREPGVKYYLGLSAGGLGTVFLVMSHRGAESWGTYLPFVVGGLTAAVGWNKAPLAFLATLAAVLSLEPNRTLFNRSGEAQLTDLLLAAGALGFVAAQYRLQGLLKSVFPVAAAGPTTSVAQVLPGEARKNASPYRDARGVSLAEVGWLLLFLPAWGALGLMTSEILPTTAGNPGLQRPVWRAMTLIWLLGVTGLVVAGVFDYYRRRRLTPVEALLFLQDVAWQETRHEQRRIDRWSAWARRGPARNSFGTFLDVLEAIVEVVIQLCLLLWIVALVSVVWYLVLIWQQQ